MEIQISLTGSLHTVAAPEAGSGSARSENCGPSSISNVPYIYKVHHSLREVNPDAYEPKLIAIGPYHHGKDRTRMMEAHKKRYMKSILEQNNVNDGELFSAVEKISDQAMAAYSHCVEVTLHEFVTMLVTDGCFIIELMRKFKKENGDSLQNDPYFQGLWIINNLHRDLMLFENQIPFFVLYKIYKVIFKGPDEGKLTFLDLILGFFENSAFGKGYKTSTKRPPKDIKFLLDLIHGSWKPQDDFIRIDQQTSSSAFIGSAVDLKDGNIRLRKKENEDSLFQIEFARGTLKIPRIEINDDTESYIRNLIAYEQYHPVPGHNFITDYALFIDCLVDTSADIKLLQSKGIIENWMGDNQVVASFVNKITDSVVLSDVSNFRYAKIFVEINRFQNRRCNRHMAILNRDYFNTPWTIFSVIAAFLLLVLTFLSTVFTAMQTFKK